MQVALSAAKRKGGAVITEHSSGNNMSENGKDERAWYAIHTYSGFENKVKSHLEARIASMNMRIRFSASSCRWKKRWRLNRASDVLFRRRYFPAMCWSR